MQLLIGNKNYSSWSMRPWVLMRQLGIAFDEVMVRFDFDADSLFRQAVARHSPAGRVPVLVEDDGFAVWDTLAIAERLADLHPQAGVWPTAGRARARARSLCAEMHSGFSTLRSVCPMNIEAKLGSVGQRLMADNAGLRHDLARIEQAWDDALATSGGPMLFGDFSAADAFFAPVCMRVLTYELPLGVVASAYVQRVAALPGVRAWVADALEEHCWVSEDEPYRSPPA